MQPIFFYAQVRPIKIAVDTLSTTTVSLSLPVLPQHTPLANPAGGPECHKMERESHISPTAAKQQRGADNLQHSQLVLKAKDNSKTEQQFVFL